MVKGVHLEGLRVLGRPEWFARRYEEMGADELLYVDVVASLYGQSAVLEVVERTASEIFIPLTVGGGIRTLDDVRSVLRAGADKVAINTGAVEDVAFVQRASRQFGSSTIVVSIEAIRRPDGGHDAFTNNGREATGLDTTDWACRVAEAGAGELIVTSVDREGTGRGYDLELTYRIAEAVDIPVVACGGAGNVDHVVEVARTGRADAVGVASMLHYDLLAHRGPNDDLAELVAASEGNAEYLRRLTVPRRLAPAPVPEIKKAMTVAGIDCRVLVA